MEKELDQKNIPDHFEELAAERHTNDVQLSGFEDLGAIATLKRFKYASFMCILVTFSAAADGYQIGMNGNIIANTGFIRQFATETDAEGNPILAAGVLATWGPIMSVGQFVGMTTLPLQVPAKVSCLANRYGRKPTLFAIWFILSMSILCESLARNWKVWLVGKLLAGVGVGGIQFTIPTYVAEVAPVRIRGMLLMLYNFWFSLGNFFAPVCRK
ncbi:hypothetical protein HD553DRAFT_337956 [Filobasidium floriforme]|uniref:uncharacterized protein n=1 Tax=Filobasidium floriforme TaxID=5210 RepID=UPI001E8CCA35|nr:uncharacterized protein HD553DRAFT_337956 [Filobasidium floriforme]KAH8090267.1 hypothetical protein HD553DRAFT_337956 [Filobasidium floriforme]